MGSSFSLFPSTSGTSASCSSSDTAAQSHSGYGGRSSSIATRGRRPRYHSRSLTLVRKEQVYGKYGKAGRVGGGGGGGGKGGGGGGGGKGGGGGGGGGGGKGGSNSDGGDRKGEGTGSGGYGGAVKGVERRHPYVPHPYAPPAHRRQPSKAIPDRYTTFEQVQEALREAGLESSNLIVGFDFTKSNEWTGRSCFGGRSLHAIGGEPNPYMEATSIIGHMLNSFDDDNEIPCFGFGDATTHDSGVFSFFADHRPCNGFEEALMRYKQIAPYVRLAGPTSFAPIIEMAIGIVEASGGSYHILLIIADGQVTRSIDTDANKLSVQEEATINAIVAASDYALSIVMVGVGDGPWDMMKAFDDHLPQRAFDNFQFVNFTEISSKPLTQKEKELKFAVAALMEIPCQYQATVDMRLLGRRTGNAPIRAPLPPPTAVLQADMRRELRSDPHSDPDRSRHVQMVQMVQVSPVKPCPDGPARPMALVFRTDPDMSRLTAHLPHQQPMRMLKLMPMKIDSEDATSAKEVGSLL
ncbi:hypothetical protein CBR_g3706 [Chara braunii]|uniref:Copine C-terminal domain-containing protein n=1 Tax=Chara braunii TaxID=69332 RepID=A0A388KG74_CHABU|nr:hypothetical protein CBR_g3706 [Chara braunii]|eukprot:GBG69007.1 hypothetical protein CBR_g3706 [Chara braunii]